VVEPVLAVIDVMDRPGRTTPGSEVGHYVDVSADRPEAENSKGTARRGVEAVVSVSGEWAGVTPGP
jgi:hypothetical protein